MDFKVILGRAQEAVERGGPTARIKVDIPRLPMQEGLPVHFMRLDGRSGPLGRILKVDRERKITTAEFDAGKVVNFLDGANHRIGIQIPRDLHNLARDVAKHRKVRTGLVIEEALTAYLVPPTLALLAVLCLSLPAHADNSTFTDRELLIPQIELPKAPETLIWRDEVYVKKQPDIVELPIARGAALWRNRHPILSKCERAVTWPVRAPWNGIGWIGDHVPERVTKGLSFLGAAGAVAGPFVYGFRR